MGFKLEPNIIHLYFVAHEDQGPDPRDGLKQAKDVQRVVEPLISLKSLLTLRRQIRIVLLANLVSYNLHQVHCPQYQREVTSLHIQNMHEKDDERRRKVGSYVSLKLRRLAQNDDVTVVGCPFDPSTVVCVLERSRLELFVGWQHCVL